MWPDDAEACIVTFWHPEWQCVAFMRYAGETADPHAHHSTDRWELYNVAVDPSECHDLAAEQPERLAQLITARMNQGGECGRPSGASG